MTRKALFLKSLKEPKFKTRKISRCFRCGRAKGYMRKFKICRICFRELAHQGAIPGLRKASW